MAGKIKGITIEFRGETTKLDKALKQVKSDTAGIDKQLRSVNNALKFNPKNTELLAQKMTLLKSKISNTEDSLKLLKQQQAQMDADGVDKSSEEYMKLQREIITTESKLKAFNSQLQQTAAQASRIGQLGQSFQDAGRKMTQAGQALRTISMVSAAVATGLGAVTYKAAVAADDINTLSKVTGVSTRDLQMYAAAADLVDVSVEVMAKSHSKMKKSMLSASKGTGDAATAWKELGIEVTNADGSLRDGNAVYDETIAALGKMENETQRDAYAMAIFGRSAADLNPLIEDGGETYAKVAEIMEKHGLEPISQEDLDKANEFNDAIDVIKFTWAQALQIIGTKIAAYLVPAINKVQEVFATVAGGLASLSGGMLAKLGGLAGIGAALSPVLLVLGSVTTKMGEMLEKTALLVQKVPVLGKAFSFLKANPIILIAAAVAGLAYAIGKSGLDGDAIAKRINGIMNKVSKAAPKIIKSILIVIKDVGKALLDALPVMLDGVIALVEGLAKSLPKLISVIVPAAVKLFNGLVQAIPRVLPALLTAFNGLIASLIKAMPTLVPALLNAAITLFSTLVKAIPTVARSLASALPQIGSVMVNYFKGLVTSVKNVFASVGNYLGSVFANAWAAIKAKFAGWGSFWSGLWGQVKSRFSSIGTAMASAMSGAVRSGMNAVISKVQSIINGAIDLINAAISAADKIVPGKLGRVKKVSLPRLAKGGVLQDAQMVIAGEAGPEAIIPLEKLWSQMDRMANKIISGSSNAILGQAMVAAVAQMGQMIANSMPEDIIINMNGQAVAQAIWGDLNSEAVRRGGMFSPSVNQIKGAKL